jgi:Reverse transcriptase (RNA-dependent DNA polymerase)/Endonuclease-reverse transcriptase
MQVPKQKAPFLVSAWNANGIQARRTEFHSFITTNSIDVALLCETRLTANNRLLLANYAVYRTDRPTGRGGGTAIAVKTGIKHHQLVLPALAQLEATGVMTTTRNGPLRIIAVYRPPRGVLCATDIAKLLDAPEPTIIGGDFNAKHPAWNSRIVSPAGRALLKLSQDTGFNVLGPPRHTYFRIAGRIKTSDVLDIFITQNLRQSIDIANISALTSDHNPIIATIGDSLIQSDPVIRRNFRKADWDSYRAEIDAKLADYAPDLASPSDIDAAVDALTAAIQSATETSVPLVKASRNELFDLPPSILRAIKIKNATRRAWQHLRTPDLRRQYNGMVAELKITIREHLSARWDKTLADLSPTNGSIWRMARKMSRRPEPSPPIQGKFHLACSAKDKAEVFAESLEEQFQPNPANAVTAAVDAFVADFLATDHHDEPPIEPCTMAELSKLATALPNGKAPGPDNIVNQALKEMPFSACDLLLRIINASLSHCHFPSPWQTGKVILFPKPGKPLRSPKSYRPISLLPTMSKLLEKVVLARLQSFIDANNILIDQQCGFRKEHSTADQLLRVVHHISHGFNTNRSTGAVFLDVASAFDKVWHSGLITDLIQMHFHPPIIRFIHSYLSNRKFFVSVQEQHSRPRPILAGVPQGSVLGPVLFNLHTNDFPTNIPGVEVALYADDAALLARSFSTRRIGKLLQTAMDTVSAWYASKRIAINPAKTTATLFEPTKRRRGDPAVTLHGSPIAWAPHNRYLGVELDAHLTWRPHVERVHSATSKKLASLWPLLRGKTLTPTVKARVYTTIVRPGLTYASPIWSGCADHHLERLQRLQNRVLKAALSLPRFARTADIHRQLNIEPLHVFMRRLNRDFLQRAADHTNPLIESSILNPSPWDRFYRPIHSAYI